MFCYFSGTPAPAPITTTPSVVPKRAVQPNDVVLNTETDHYIQWSDSGMCCPVPKCNNVHLGFKRDFIKHWQVCTFNGILSFVVLEY